MVKCTCGRKFKRLTELRGHFRLYKRAKQAALHVPDRENADTEKAIIRSRKVK